MNRSLKSFVAFGKARGRESIWFFAGITVAIVGSATAQYAATGTQSQPCVLDQAMQDAVNKKVQLIGMTSPDPGKYFNAGSPDSCLGNMSIANLDLSKLIPDPLGLLSVGVDSVIDALKKAALAAGCAAVRNSVGDTINKYNSAIRDVNGIVDVKGQTNQFIDSTIANTSRQVLDGYAMNWKTPTAPNATAGVQVSNAPVVLPKIPAVTTPAATAQPAAGSSGSSGLGASIFK